MTSNDIFTMEDISFYRHWHLQSERFAGGDSLATALFEGWTLREPVLRDNYWCAGTREVHVFHFHLMRDGAYMTLPVLGNPFVDRLIKEMNMAVVVSDEPKTFLIQAAAPAFVPVVSR